MFTLNLPKPSQNLLDALNQDINDVIPNYVPHTYLRPKWADGAYFLNRTLAVGTEEYKHFFTDEFHVFGMMVKPEPWTRPRPIGFHTSYFPPHCDAERLTGLNFIIDQGGSNVTTTFYDKRLPEGSLGAISAEFDEIAPIRSYHYDKETWYALDSARYHSIENIEHDRLILMMTFKTLPFSEFLIKYSHLIDKIV